MKKKKLTLKICKKGDVLISVHGKAFIYDHYDKHRPYPHIITDAISEVECSRLDNGQVFKNNRMESDDDIVKIISIKQ